MGLRIYWTPSTAPDAYQYELRRSPGLPASFDFWQRLSALKSGPQYDAVHDRFFADDASGDASTVYDVLTFTASGDVADQTGPFQPEIVQAASLLARTKVDHDYGGLDQLRYIASGGVGIPDAEIRIYRRMDYDQGRTALPVFRVETDHEGRWKAPVFLEPGLDYTVYFAKTGLYGPDTRIITV